MGAQFMRLYEVQVGELVLKQLDLSFTVTKTLKKEPNTCELIIYNLTQDNRSAIQELENATVQIKAGYRGIPELPDSATAATDAALGTGGGDTGKPGLLFLGDVRDADSLYEPPDWVTVVEGGDGEAAIRTSRVNKSFTSGTSVQTVVNELAKSMKTGLGNAAKKALESGSLVEAGAEFLNGVTVSGPAYRELDHIVRSVGQELSVQDGVIQILDLGKPLEDISVVLTPNTGLLGSPTIGKKGVVKFRALLNSDIVPGRQIELSSRALDGRFRAESCEYNGDTSGSDWYVDVEAREL